MTDQVTEDYIAEVHRLRDDEIERLRREVERRDAVLDWIEKNVPSSLELCPFKLVRPS